MSIKALMNPSFALRLYLLVVLVTVGAMVSLSSVFLVSQNRAMQSALDQQGVTISKSLSESVRVGVLLESPQYISEAITGLGGLPSLKLLRFYRADGSVLLGVDKQLQVSSPPATAFVQAARVSIWRQTLIIPLSMGEENGAGEGMIRTFLVPVTSRNNKATAGFVWFGFSDELRVKSWQQTLFTTVAVTILLVFFALAAAYLLIRRLTQPLRELTRGAQQVEAGNLAVEVPIASNDELGGLVGRFNRMTTALRKNQLEIERKATALQQSEAKYRRLFEDIQQPLVIATLDWRVLDCNQALADLLGYPDPAAVVQGQVLLFQGVEPNPSEKIKQRLLAAKSGLKDVEYTLQTQSGAQAHILLTLQLHRNEAGTVIGFEGLISDITGLKALQEQLSHGKKMQAIGTLASGVAHDFNNQLAVMMSCCESLLEKHQADAEMAQALNHILTAGYRGSGIVRNLLRFARDESTRLVLLSPGDLIGDIVMLARASFDPRVEIKQSLVDGLWPIVGDADQMHQLLMNLMVNARDAVLAQGGGTITVSAENLMRNETGQPGLTVLNPYFYLTVRDNGCGMSPEVVEQVFNPFFTTKPVDRGTGLGLATVHTVVENHNGTIHLDSTPKVGTVFHVYLPAQPNRESEVDEAPLFVGDSSPVTPVIPDGSVLIVEDEDILREVLQAHLSDLGYRVTTAANGHEGLIQLSQSHTALVILDVMMPGLSGADTLRRIRQSHPTLPVIMVSGYAELDMGEQFDGFNYQAMLQKPFSLVDVARHGASALNDTR